MLLYHMKNCNFGFEQYGFTLLCYGEIFDYIIHQGNDILTLCLTEIDTEKYQTIVIYYFYFDFIEKKEKSMSAESIMYNKEN